MCNVHLFCNWLSFNVHPGSSSLSEDSPLLRSEFMDFKGYKFSYANAPISEELFFQSNGLLEEKGLENRQVRIFEWDNIKCFFKVGQKSAIPFDIFSATRVWEATATESINIVNIVHTYNKI